MSAPNPHKEWSEVAVCVAFMLFILAALWLFKK